MDCIVIGAGVVGLAIARSVARAGHAVLVLERETQFGRGTSARNSEVVHAGLYHPPDWLKTRLCTEGRALLYDYCGARGIAHRRCGKLVVAISAADIPALEAMAARGRANGAPGLRLISGVEARAMEPELRCVAALHSPETGIVDAHGLMLALLGEAEQFGARLVCHAEVLGLSRAGAAWEIAVRSGGEITRVAAGCVVNAAGIGAQKIAAGTEGFGEIPALYLAKGSYFGLSGRAPFSRLIYPLPEAGGAGIHLTLDLAGQARFGPDVEWVGGEDYALDPGRAPGFAAEIRRYWPGLDATRLHPAYAGIRPKLAGPPSGGADFAIMGPAEHGLPGLVALFGIESPGLTACLAIGARVAAMLRDRFDERIHASG